MTDRRRINGPAVVTTIPVFAQTKVNPRSTVRPRTRGPNQTRKIFLKTGLTPSASGSAYLEIESPSEANLGTRPFSDAPSALKLTCAVHGPRPLPRSSPFTPQLLLSTHVKFAPFASLQRRGYVRDAGERDLAVHLETALRGVLVSERWPKSGIDVIITILEGEEDDHDDESFMHSSGNPSQVKGLGMMSILSGCITVASAAIADAGIDCVDFVTGGVAAIVRQPTIKGQNAESEMAHGHSELEELTMADPCPSEYGDLHAICVVGYLQSRDELTLLWVKGGSLEDKHDSSKIHSTPNTLIDKAIQAAVAARLVVIEAIRESTEVKVKSRSLNHG